MRDQAVEILKVERDTAADPYCTSHTVYFVDWRYDQKVIHNTKELEVVLLEDKMLKAGINKELIEKHRQLVREMVEDEREWGN